MKTGEVMLRVLARVTKANHAALISASAFLSQSHSEVVCLAPIFFPAAPTYFL